MRELIEKLERFARVRIKGTRRGWISPAARCSWLLVKASEYPRRVGPPGNATHLLGGAACCFWASLARLRSA
jgi:hypothetical protein